MDANHNWVAEIVAPEHEQHKALAFMLARSGKLYASNGSMARSCPTELPDGVYLPGTFTPIPGFDLSQFPDVVGALSRAQRSTTFKPGPRETIGNGEPFYRIDKHVGVNADWLDSAVSWGTQVTMQTTSNPVGVAGTMLDGRSFLIAGLTLAQPKAAPAPETKRVPVPDRHVVIHDGTGEVLLMSDEEIDASCEVLDVTDADRLPAGTVIGNVGMGVSTVRPSMDFETYSAAGFKVDPVTKKVTTAGSKSSKGGLAVVGTPVYAEHPSTEIICLYYDLKDGKGRRGWMPGTPYPRDLLDHVARGGDMEAFNVTFEWWIWNMICVRRFGWPPLQFEQCHCVMARARRYSLPGSLGKVAEALGTADKDKKGQQLIQKLCRPHTPTKNRPDIRWTAQTAWDDYVAMYSYCDQDVKTEDEAAARIPDHTPDERATWLVDQHINARGVQVDRQALDAALAIMHQMFDLFTQELQFITNGEVKSVAEVANMRDFLGRNGLPLDNLRAETVTETLERKDLSPLCRRILEIRDALAGANIKKLTTLDLQLNSDNRLRDQYTYNGPATGRWSAGGVQLQNITSKGPGSKTCNDCGRHVGAKCESCPECMSNQFTKNNEWTVESVEWAIKDILTRDLQYCISVWGDPATMLAGCLRGLFIAPEGKTLVCCDFSAIEAVVLACLARCQWRIDVFQTHGKIYEMSASSITGVPFDEFAAYKKANGMHHPLRKKVGKVAELACFSPDTQVLTRRGYVPIVDVKPTDELWDGVEWVKSDGAIYKGRREIISLDGVKVTPDHPVSLGGSWKGAKLLASNKYMLNLALVNGSANLPSFAMRKGVEGGEQSALAPAAQSALSTYLTCIAASLRDALNVGERKAERRMLNGISSMPKSCRTTNTVAVFAIDSVPQSEGATTATIGAMGTMAAEASKFVTNGGSQNALSCSTSRLLTDGMTPHWKWIGSTQTETMSRGTSVSSPKQKTIKTNGQYKNCNDGSTNSSDVYDIVNAGPRHRFTIKTDSGHLIVHNSGYGGWIGAWKNFGAGENMTDDEIKENILAWRAASPEIEEFWGGQWKWCGPGKWDFKRELFGLEGAAIAAILNPGQCFHVIDITFGMKDDVLFCRLPSGRFLQYHKPRLNKVPDRLNRGDIYQITFMGYNTNSQKGRIGWVRMETYGGRLAENVTQAVAADIQAFALKNLERRNYPVVMHTHDEAISEIPLGAGSVEEMVEIMSERPAWASWWPIRAAGWMHKRYQKD